MSHMVIFRTPEGKPGYQQADAVEDAVSIVERLRNEDGVENVRIYRLEEIAFEYKPYYKVELASSPSDTPSDAPSAVEPTADSAERSEGRSEPTRIFGAPSIEASDAELIADLTTGAEPVETTADEPAEENAERPADEIAAVVEPEFGASSHDDAPSEHSETSSADQPPWAAPPPPPPVLEQPRSEGGFGDGRPDDEFSGQRRGLFGR